MRNLQDNRQKDRAAARLRFDPKPMKVFFFLTGDVGWGDQMDALQHEQLSVRLGGEVATSELNLALHRTAGASQHQRESRFYTTVLR